MKKLLALSLAALMVMGLATTAFATAVYDPTVTTLEIETPNTANDNSANAVWSIGEGGYPESDSVVKVIVGAWDASGVRSGTRDNSLDAIDPGKTIYYPLLTTDKDPTALYADDFYVDFVTYSEAVKSAKVTLKYTLGQDLLDSAKIVYKKYDFTAYAYTSTANPTAKTDADHTAYAYFLALTFKSSTSTAARDFAADLTLKKTSGTDKTVASGADANLAFDMVVSVSLPVKFGGATDIVTDSDKTFDYKGQEGDVTLTFQKFDGAYFEVDITGQDKILLKADAKYDAAIAGKFPAANINFFNGYNRSFNKIGELRIPAEPDSFIYAIAADGTLSALRAEYDDSEECFVIKTRTLGYYAISDKELDIAPAVAPAPSEPVDAPAPVDPGKANPGTGAVA